MIPRRLVSVLLAGAALASVALLQFVLSGASFSSASPAHGGAVSGATDWVAPTQSSAVIAKTTSGSPSGGTAAVHQGGTYRVYANASDTNSGLASVTADVSTVTTGQTAVAMTAGSYTVGGVTYNYASAELTANATLSQGTKSFSVRATDQTANVRTNPYSATVDNTAPSASMTDPGAYLRGTVTLDGTGTDALSGLESVKLRIAPTGTSTWTTVCTTSSSPASCSLDTTAYTDGGYDVQALVTDNAGNTMTSTVSSRTIDNATPGIARTVLVRTANVTPLLTTGYVGQGGTYRIYAQASDATSGLNAVTADASSLTTGQATVAMTAGSYTVAGQTYNYATAELTADGTISAGAKTVSVRATDNATNSTTANPSATVDNTAPTASMTDPGAYLKGTPTLGATATDAVGLEYLKIRVAPTGTSNWTDVCSGGTSPASCSFNTTAYIDGGYDLQALAIDRAGNATTSTVGNRTIDNTAPAVTRTVLVRTTSGTPGSTTGYVRQGGTYRIYAQATDAMSGVSAVSANASTVTTGQNAAAMTSGSYTVAGQTYNYASAELTADATLAEGAKTVTVIATDNATNSGTANPPASIDNTAPSTAMTNPGAYLKGTVTLGATASDAGAGLESLVIRVAPTGTTTWTTVCTAAASPASCSLNTTTYTDGGGYDFQSLATDAVGNTATSTQTNKIVDNTAPAIARTVLVRTTSGTPASTTGFVTQGGTYKVYAQVSDATSGVSGVTVNASAITTGQTAATMSSGSYTVAGQTYNYASAELTANGSLAEGAKAVTVSASDNATNSSTLNPSATVDNTAPSVTVGTITGSVVGAGQAGCQFIDNTNKAVFFSTANNSLTCSNLNGTGGTPKNGTFTVPVTASDAQSAMLKVNFPSLTGAVSGGGDVVGAGPSYSMTYVWNTSTTGSGSGITGFDNAGLTTVAPFSATLDNTAPSATAPVTAGGFTSTLSIPVTRGTGTDNAGGSGVASTTLQRAEAALTSGVCGAFGSFANVTLTGGSDASVVNDRCYKYQELATDNVGNQGASAASSIVITDNTVPTITVNNLTASANPCQFLTGTSFFYSTTSANGNSCALMSGSFTVPATAADAQSGILKVNFQPIPGMTGGGDDPTSPYSTSYSWDAATTSFTGSRDATASNNSQLTAVDTFSVALDNTAPAGGAITANGSTSASYNSSGSITLTKTNFTDTGGSGIASNVITRASGTLSGDSCGALSGATVVTSPNAVTNGCYQYTLTGTDRVGNQSTVVSAVVKVDTTGPTQSLALSGTTGPANGQHINNSPSYATNPYVFINAAGATSNSFTVTDTAADPDTGVTSVSFPVNPTTPKLTGGGVQNASPYTTSYSWSSTGTTGQVSVTGTSLSNATSTSPFNVVKDVVAPGSAALTVNGTAATLAGASSFNTTGSYSISALTHYSENETTTTSGLNSSTLTRQDGTLANNSCSSFGSASTIPGSAPISQSGLAEGCYLYTVTGIDNVGNTAAISTTAKVDKSNPTGGAITANGSAADSYNTTGTVSLGKTDFSDGLSGIASNNVTRATGTLSNDVCGPISGATAVTITGGNDPAALGTGCYRYTLTGTDNAGNSATAVSAVVKVDKGLPTGGAITANGSATASFNTTGTIALGKTDFTDAQTSMASNVVTRASASLSNNVCGTFSGGTPVTISGGNDPAALANGCYQYTLTGTDVAGNQATVVSAIVKVDKVAPSSTITVNPASPNGSNSWYQTTAPTFTLAATDTHTGVASRLYKIDNGTTQTYSAAVAIPDGQHTITYWATDNAGNSETPTTTSTLKVDTVAPATTIALSPSSPNGTNSWYKTTAPTFTLSATDATSGVASTSYQIDGGATQAYSTAVTIPEGQHTVTYWSADNAGNLATGTTTATIKVDTTNPLNNVTISTPVAAYQSGTTLYYRGNIGTGSFKLVDTVTESGSGLGGSAVSFPAISTTGWTHNAETKASATASTAFSWATNPSNPAGYSVTATDLAGNSASTALTFVNDSTAPDAPTTTSLPTAIKNGQALTVPSAGDNVGGSGVSSVEYFRCTMPCTTPSTSIGIGPVGPGFSFTWSSMPADGTYLIAAKSTDNVTNVSTLGPTQQVIVENTPAPTAITFPARGTNLGKPEAGDSMAVTFSGPLSVSSLCGSWTGDTSNQSVTDASVTIVNNNANTANHDGILATGISSATCGTVRFGKVDLIGTAYVTADTTFTNSTLAWDAATNKLIITLGTLSSGTIGAGDTGNRASKYTPDSGINGSSGAPIDTTVLTAASQGQF